MGTLTSLLTGERLLTLGLLAVVAAGGAAFGEQWARAARARGGTWYLEMLLYTCGILNPLTGAFGVGGSAALALGTGLALFALFASLGNVRPGVATLASVIAFFYGSLIVSAYFGAVPVELFGIPQRLWSTPLIVLAFVLHGGYTAQWLQRQIVVILRLLVVISLVTAVALPDVGINLEESRTVFGFNRLQGVLGHPNTMAAVAALLLIAELAFTGWSLWLVPAVLGLTLAQSNTTWVGVLVALPFLASRLGRTVGVVAYVGALGALVIGIVAARPAWLTATSFFPRNWETLNGRTDIWAAAIRGGYRGHELLGYGPTLLDDTFRSTYLPSFDAAAQAHNQFVQNLAGEGIVGLVALITFIAVLVGTPFARGASHGGFTLAATALLIVRMMTETPIRPTGANVGTFIVIATVALIATLPANSRKLRKEPLLRDADAQAEPARHWL